MLLLSHHRKWFRPFLLGLLFVAALLLPVAACGPFFAPDLLSHGDKTLLAAPVADFYVEVARLKPQKPASFTANVPACNSSRPALGAGTEKDVFERTENFAVADLRDALRDQPAARQEELVAAYGKVRADIRDYAQKLQQWNWSGKRTPRPATPNLVIPAGLPGEFDAYLRGAIAYHRGGNAEAQQAWRRLLERPAAERKYRSTWAAFMLGRCAMLEGDAGEAIRQFKRVRELSQAGFSDRTGLAAASLGWQARIELDRKCYDQAIGLYLAQAATGDPTAANSLRETAVQVFETPDPETLAVLARDESSRQVLTAFLIASGGPIQGCRSDLADAQRVNAWLEVCAKVGVKQLAGADRLAWAAYQTGDWATAGRWLEQADEASPIAKWIRAKLCLREGKVEEAGKLLTEVSRLFPAEEEWKGVQTGMEEGERAESDFKPAQRVRGEWGVLQFARRNYVQALDALLLAGYWKDAAYVAERVLKPDELKAYVDHHWPESAAQKTARSDDLDTCGAIRNLLARRLVRLERMADARAYFPPDLRPKLDAYATALAAGRDPQRPASERSAYLWEAARIARYEGLTLMGTELAPDGAICGGSYDLGLAASDIRPKEAGDNDGGSCFQQTQGLQVANAKPEPNAPSSLFIQDQEFKDRLADSMPPFDKRYHYRYLAAKTAWEAIQPMSDGDPQKAAALCEAGSWIKYRDPKAGDQFYRALVQRFRPKIRIGQAALAAGIGVLLLLVSIVVVRAIRRWQRPQYSLAWFMAMMLAAAVGLLGGLHWYASVQALAEARGEWRNPPCRPVYAEGSAVQVGEALTDTPAVSNQEAMREAAAAEPTE